MTRRTLERRLHAIALATAEAPLDATGTRLPVTYHRPKSGRALANELRIADALAKRARERADPTAFLRGVQAALRWALLDGPVRPTARAVEVVDA
jgi:hypothetical protein